MNSNIREARKKEALSQIKKLADELGRNPKIKDWQEHGMSPTSGTISNLFGSWKKAVTKATGKSYSKAVWTREKIIAILKKLNDQIGHAPSRNDFQKLTDIGEAPHWRTVLRMFGSWDKALDETECLRIFRLEYTRSEMISQLHWMRIELGYIPRSLDLAKFQGVASPKKFNREFGSWNKALEAAGLSIYSRESLLEQMKEMAEELGRSPSHVDCEKFSAKGRTACPRKFEKVFGSWNAAVRAAGYEPNRLISNPSFTREKLIDLIKKMHVELGRTPTLSDCKERYQPNVFASVSVFLYRFGSWNEAIKAAGLVPNRQLPWIAKLRN